MTQPEALRLADELDQYLYSVPAHPLCTDAAAELRRLHGEIKSMRAERLRSERRLLDVKAQRDALLAEHQQTLALQQRSYEREIQLEVEAEREACAALLEANGMRCGEESLSRLILETNAAAIRARNP